jgi:phage baseplate assembly protein W
MPIDVRIPVAPDERGTIGTIEDYEESVKQQLKNIILTNPGERIYDSNYGVGIRLILFDQKTQFTLSELKARINAQIARYAPYVELQDVAVTSIEEDENAISVKIFYSIRSIDNYSDSLELNFNNVITI